MWCGFKFKCLNVKINSGQSQFSQLTLVNCEFRNTTTFIILIARAKSLDSLVLQYCNTKASSDFGADFVSKNLLDNDFVRVGGNLLKRIGSLEISGCTASFTGDFLSWIAGARIIVTTLHLHGTAGFIHPSLLIENIAIVVDSCEWFHKYFLHIFIYIYIQPIMTTIMPTMFIFQASML